MTFLEEIIREIRKTEPKNINVTESIENEDDFMLNVYYEYAIVDLISSEDNMDITINITDIQILNKSYVILDLRDNIEKAIKAFYNNYLIDVVTTSTAIR